MSFGAGKQDGELLQKLFYLSPTITNLQPNMAVCMHLIVGNLHSHKHKLPTDLHIPTWGILEVVQDCIHIVKAKQPSEGQPHDP